MWRWIVLALYGIALVLLVALSPDAKARRIKIKPGVEMHGINIVMRNALVEAASIWQDHGQVLVVTSVTESVHSPGSYHYYGYALDFRVFYFSQKESLTVYHELRAALTSRYVVLHEGDHIHVHYRPRGGRD